MDWWNAIAMPVISAFAAFLTAAVRHLWNRQKMQAAQQESIREGMLALMHDRIYSIYAECQKKGFATVEELKNLEYLYSPYHALGGNSTGTELFERVKKMPVQPEER